MAFELTNYEKTILIITIYRIPNGTGGVYSTLNQYNQGDGKVKSANTYRKEILNEIKQYIKSKSNINDTMIAGDFNQFISSNKIQVFFNQISI